MNTKHMACIHKLFYVKKNEIVIAEELIDLEITVLLEKKLASERHSLHVFSPMWHLVGKGVKIKGS